MPASARDVYDILFRDTESVGQRLGKAEILLVRAVPHMFRFYFIEGGQQLLLIVGTEHSVGQREQDVVFLLNMSAEKLDISEGIGCKSLQRPGVAGGSGFGIFVHAANKVSSLVVFDEHLSDRSAVSRHALVDHGREQMFLFFAVMATIGKRANEIYDLLGRFQLQLTLVAGFLDESLEAAEYYFNDPVFL